MASAEVLNAPGIPSLKNDVSGHLPKLRSNQGNYVAPSSTGWMRPTPSDTPIEEMRKRFHDEGYVWIKHVIPRDVVYDMREHYFSRFAHTGMLSPNTSPGDGIFNTSSDPTSHQGIGGVPVDSTNALLDAAHADPTYRTFLAHPSLRAFIRQFTGWKQERIVDRAMLRHNCPGSQSTGIHYDQYFLRDGDDEFLTAWVPIGDCAATGGGLMYLENSTSLGIHLESEFLKKAEHLPKKERIDAFNRFMAKDGFMSHDAVEFQEMNRDKVGRWLVGDYEAGDVVFHNPWMVHAATKNEDVLGRIRLASDLRFYEEGAKLDPRWMKIWTHDDGL
ncbi:MAG: hypothetical protein L6R38_003990 [Xanthoria sp. 2 TBL-2021]|nr:MAG: hypothetical protein L6R38_003990 [Xanthoria sp. 2 TBL-2021]